ncbi:centromere kinetochore component CENP-T-domain-containing protein [Geopyxis carbonaria]|nr:centromere kinetochore component CENP-T-domain-containing protein [Geopyxis carbonaria]
MDPPRAPPKITPRNSTVPDDEETPRNTQQLVELSKAVHKTPERPPIAPARRSVRRTPGAGRLNPKSPHVVRAFEQRKALTPGRERRRSGRNLAAKETPRDLLRILSRTLAPTSQSFQTPRIPARTPATLSTRRSFSAPAADEDEDEAETTLPRMRSRLSDSPESDSALVVPRLSMALDDYHASYSSPAAGAHAASDPGDLTSQSIELPRRAYFPRERHSFGIRLSDQFADLQDMEGMEGMAAGVGDESGIVPEGYGELGPSQEMVGSVEEGVGMEIVEGETEVLDVDGVPEGVGAGEDSFFMTLPPGLDDDDSDGGAGDDGGDDGYEDIDDYTAHNALDDPLNNPLDNPDPSLSPAPASPLPHQQQHTLLAIRPARKPKPRLISKAGVEYPRFPPDAIKKLASRAMGGQRVPKDVLAAVEAASESFFEQMSLDLGRFAAHAGRRVINDADAVQLLKRYPFPPLCVSFLCVLCLCVLYGDGDNALLSYTNWSMICMYRQRQVNKQTTTFSLAQRFLPRELAQEVRMPVDAVQARHRAKAAAKAARTAHEDGDGDAG